MQLVDTLDVCLPAEEKIWAQYCMTKILSQITQENNLPHKLLPTCQILVVDGSSLYFRHKRFYHFELSSLDPVPNQF